MRHRDSLPAAISFLLVSKLLTDTLFELVDGLVAEQLNRKPHSEAIVVHVRVRIVHSDVLKQSAII